MHPVIDFSVRTDQVVTGQNYEMADMDNPKGHVYGFAAYVQSESEYGERREMLVGTFAHDSTAVERAEALAVRLRARLKLGKLPVGFDRWHEARPCYGSQAYEDFGAADDCALERREADEERWL